MTVPVSQQQQAIHFSPANQLLHEVRELGAEIHPGTPAWAQFPRWYTRGGTLWLESSSGSRMLTVRFDTGEIIVPEWSPQAGSRPMPANWLRLYRGSLFASDGSAIDREAFAAASAQDGWKGGSL